MNFTLQFLSYIREVVIETISYFIRIVRDFSINQYRCRLTFIEVTNINNILNTTPYFSDVFTVFSKMFNNTSTVGPSQKATVIVTNYMGTLVLFLESVQGALVSVNDGNLKNLVITSHTKKRRGNNFLVNRKK